MLHARAVLIMMRVASTVSGIVWLPVESWDAMGILSRPALYDYTLVEDWILANIKIGDATCVQQPTCMVKWEAPSTHQIAINTDGSEMEGNAGYGGILRSNDGGWIHGYYGSLGEKDILHKMLELIETLWYYIFWNTLNDLRTRKLINVPEEGAEILKGYAQKGVLGRLKCLPPRSSTGSADRSSSQDSSYSPVYSCADSKKKSRRNESSDSSSPEGRRSRKSRSKRRSPSSERGTSKKQNGNRKGKGKFVREEIRGRKSKEEDKLDPKTEKGVEAKTIVNQFGISTYRLYSLPFTARLMKARIPHRFQKMNLSIPPYTGETDPGKHLDAFMNEMLFQNADEDLQCRIFPKSLQGEALTWFKSLPTNSVGGWEELALAFSKRFAQAGEVPRDS
ncbi:hypothetical protein SESBI_24478 [Sesbania bispinosa]|nr:hypothetical protein SESBI_24478 [Sesbania bispinosa]